MADKVYNINDYRRKSYSGTSGDTVENIRIEDPLDFLNASEKEEYIRERHREEDERIRKHEEAERRLSAAARSLPEEERARIKRDTDDPAGEKRARPRREDAYKAEDERRGRSQREQQAARAGAEPRRSGRKRAPERPKRPRPLQDDYDEEEFEEEEGADDGSRGIYIASGILGVLIVLVILFMLWMRFLMPGPTEPEAEARAIQEAESAERAVEGGLTTEEDAALRELLAQGFEKRGDTVVTTSALNIRSEPDSSRDNVVDQVLAGTSLTRVAENTKTGWSAVLLSGHEEILFCATQYLEAE